MSNALFNSVKNIEGLQDQTETSTGFTRSVPAAGPAVARFVGYVEVGSHIKQFEGKDKPSAPQVWVTFELHGRHVEKREKDGKEVVFHPTITEKLPLSLNSKASFKKLFKAMVAGRDGITNMTQMLGEAFLLRITHNTDSKDPKKIYANLKADGAWGVGAPYKEDLETGEAIKLNVPEATDGSGQVLIWDAPSEEQWESIFIDGTYEKKVGDETVNVSKNFIQETCLQATNFEGSPLQAMLAAGGKIDDLISGMKKPADDDGIDMIDDEDKAPETPETPEEDLPETPKEDEIPEKTEEELLADLGL